MRLSFALEQLACAAPPAVVLAGLRLLPGVTDVSEQQDGSVVGVVHDELPQVVTLSEPERIEWAACSCGSFGEDGACAHAVATGLHLLQSDPAFDAAALARWERTVHALDSLDDGWTGLARSWVEARESTGERLTGPVLRFAGSLDGAIEVARRLTTMTDADAVSEFLLYLVVDHGLDGERPLSPRGVIDAETLVYGMSTLRQESVRAVTDMNLAVLESVMRTYMDRGEDLRLDPGDELRLRAVLTECCQTLGRAMVGGAVRAEAIARALHMAMDDAGSEGPSWIADVCRHLGEAAVPVGHALEEMSDGSLPARVRAEFAFASGDAEALLDVLETWAEAPYGEYLLRLPRTLSPASRLTLLTAAQRAGRVTWAPGWPAHLRTAPAGCHHAAVQEHVPKQLREHVSIGDLVLQLAQAGHGSEARTALLTHARALPLAAHAAEFGRIWAAARLGEGREGATESTFPERDKRLEKVVDAVATIPARQFHLGGLDEVRQGFASIVLTAVLLRELPRDSTGDHVDSAYWTLEFLPDERDDLRTFIAGSTDIAASLDRWDSSSKRAFRRAGRVVDLLVAADGVPLVVAEARQADPEHLAVMITATPEAGEGVAALVGLLLGHVNSAAVAVLARFTRRALGEAADDVFALLDRAAVAEPRTEDRGAFLLAVLIAQVRHERFVNDRR